MLLLFVSFCWPLFPWLRLIPLALVAVCVRLLARIAPGALDIALIAVALDALLAVVLVWLILVF